MKNSNNPASDKKSRTNTVTSHFTAKDIKRLKPLLSKESFKDLMAINEHDPIPYLDDSEGEMLDCDGLQKLAIGYWADSGPEQIFQIGEKVYFYYGLRETVCVTDAVASVIAKFYPYNKNGIFEEKCVDFEVDPPLSEVKADHEGSCRVWVIPFYEAKHDDKHFRHWVRDGGGKVRKFKSYAAAQKWIDQDFKSRHEDQNLNNPYLRDHNEIAPREYMICEL